MWCARFNTHYGLSGLIWKAKDQMCCRFRSFSDGVGVICIGYLGWVTPVGKIPSVPTSRISWALSYRVMQPALLLSFGSRHITSNPADRGYTASLQKLKTHLCKRDLGNGANSPTLHFKLSSRCRLLVSSREWTARKQSPWTPPLSSCSFEKHQWCDSNVAGPN